LLRAAGLQAVHVRVVQPAALEGEGKLVAYLTLERIAQAVISEEVATSEEVQEILEELLAFPNDTTTLVSFPGSSRHGATRCRRCCRRITPTADAPPNSDSMVL
jgi:hypothetical protein